MRILIYSWRDLKHPLKGGAEVYTDAVATEWVKMGNTVTLFCAAVEGEAEREVSACGYELVRRGSRHGVYREAKRFWKREGKGNFDLVIDEVNTRPFGCPKFIEEAMVIALFHQVAREIWYYETYWPLAMMGRYILEPRWLKSYRDIVSVTVSDSSKQSLKLYGLQNVTVIPEGFDNLSALPAKISKETDPTLIFVGRLVANKRPKDAIRAFRIVQELIPTVKLWLVGTGPLEKKLRREAVQGVTVFGGVDEELKHRLMSRAHVLIATSVREGWGLVVTEAAALGTPSICYDVAGLHDSVKASGGELTSPDPISLGKQIAERLPTWVESPPNVHPGGIWPWSDVAKRIIDVALIGVRTPDCPSEKVESLSGQDGEQTKREINNAETGLVHRLDL